MAIKWLFFSPTGIVTGFSSYWLKNSLVPIVGRLLLLLLGTILACIVSFFIVPSHNKSCCYSSGLTRRDLGDCNNGGAITLEPIGHARVDCGIYPLHIIIWISVTCLLFLLASFLWIYEWKHVQRLYNRRAEMLASNIVQLHLPEPALQSTYTHVVSVLNASAFREPASHISAGIFFPEYYITGIFMRLYGIRWLTKVLLLVHFVSIVLTMIIVIEDDLYEAWWRCYEPHTSLADLSNGVCKTTIYPRSSTWGIYVISLASLQLTTLLVYGIILYEKYVDLRDPQATLARMQITPPTNRDTLRQFLNDSFPLRSINTSQRNGGKPNA
jgi:hypothetical protein